MIAAIFEYLLKASVVTVIIYGLFLLYKVKGNYFTLNRFYLVGGISAALLLPLLTYDLPAYLGGLHAGGSVLEPLRITVYTLPEVTISGTNASPILVNGWQAGLLIYFTGLLLSLTLFFFRLIKLIKLSRGKTPMKHGNTRIFFTEPGTPVFSFFNYIFISRNLYDREDAGAILTHEQVHIRQMHSLDVILSELLCIILWFNPIAFLLKKSVRENHEYLADEVAVGITGNQNTYRLALLEHSSEIAVNSLAHNFSYSLIKRRLHMMKKPKRALHLILSVSAITVAFSLAFFACSQNENAGVKGDEFQKEQPLTVAEVMPEYPGGMAAMASFLSENITYPEAAKEKGVEGKVLVNFVIEKDGSVNHVRTLKGIGEGCDEEAERVVGMMPDWTPGYQDGQAVSVQFTLPVQFALDHADSVYREVATMPEFPGGIPALMNYLATNIKYPEEAKRDTIQGKVFVRFIIEKNGKVSGAKILRGIGGGCDEESLRVVRSLPDWKPGLDENGKPVRVEYNLPIKYALN